MLQIINKFFIFPLVLICLGPNFRIFPQRATKAQFNGHLELIGIPKIKAVPMALPQKQQLIPNSTGNFLAPYLLTADARNCPQAALASKPRE